MAVILITVGTDGVRNYFRRLDDRTTYSLGRVHVPDFVEPLVRDEGDFALILETFLRGESKPFSADEDLIWSLLAPKRYRYAALVDPLYQLKSTVASLSSQQRVPGNLAATLLKEASAVTVQAILPRLGGNTFEKSLLSEV